MSATHEARGAVSARILPVLMSGGSGTRLWPVSTEERPKQFHALLSDLSMIQETALRVAEHARIAFLPPLVVCNRRHEEMVLRQLQDLGRPAGGVVSEPFGRNTGPVAVMAALHAQAAAEDALVLLLPADHLVLDVEAFRAAIERALDAAAERIVTFGVTPTAPETGYGYIQTGAELYPGLFEVARFVEKPDRTTAEAYLADGGYSWNAGIFLYRPDLLLAEAEAHAPELARRAREAFQDAERRDGVIALRDASFSRCPAVPVDVAVMEKTRRAAVAPCDVGWADVGSWSEIWRHARKDEFENAIRGAVIAIDARGSLFWSDGPTLAAVGVSDLLVVATERHVLVLPKHRAQDVRRIVDRLKEGGP